MERFNRRCVHSSVCEGERESVREKGGAGGERDGWLSGLLNANASRLLFFSPRWRDFIGAVKLNPF